MQLPITTVILAGGLGTRIGGAKGLQPLRGRPLIDWVLDAVSQQSAEIFINANGAHDDYVRFGHPVIADRVPGWAGPLAGLHAALHCARHDWVACVPCDTPFLPGDLLERLAAAISGNACDAIVAVASGRRQPTIALCHKRVLPSLDAFLLAGGRKVSEWQRTLRLGEVVFEDADAFVNINSPEELAQANATTTDCENRAEAQ